MIRMKRSPKDFFAALLALLIACPAPNIFAAAVVNPSVPRGGASRVVAPLSALAGQPFSGMPLGSLGSLNGIPLDLGSPGTPKLSVDPVLTAPADFASYPTAASAAKSHSGGHSTSAEAAGISASKPSPTAEAAGSRVDKPVAVEQLHQAQDGGAVAPVFDGSYRRPKPTPEGDQVDDYYGTKVPDPYRWLEDPRTSRTKAWIADQNRASAAFLKGSPVREHVLMVLKQLGKVLYRKLPAKHGAYYISEQRAEGKEQPVLYKSRHLYGPRRVLLDPNNLSRKGWIALDDKSFSRNGKYMAYGLSSQGSDWMTWRIRDVETGKDSREVLRWTKFTNVIWNQESDGFYYNRHERPPPGLEYVAATGPETLYFHRLGTPQSRDRKVFEATNSPGWDTQAFFMSGNRFLVVRRTTIEGDRQRISVKDMNVPDLKPALLFDGHGEEFRLMGSDGDVFYALTDKDAPRGRYVAVDLNDPAPEHWRELIPQSKSGAVLVDVSMLK